MTFSWNKLLSCPSHCYFEFCVTCVHAACLVMSDSAVPCIIANQAPLSIEFSKQEYWSGLPCPPPGDLPNPGIKPRLSALQVDSLPSEPPTKPKNTPVGSVSLLWGIFPTQESNWCLLHCRQILYQLSYQESLRWPCKENLENTLYSQWFLCPAN